MWAILANAAVLAGLCSSWALSAAMVAYLRSKPPVQHTLIDSLHVSNYSN